MRAEHTSTRPVLVQERGIALIAALMIMLLMSALMIGFTTVVMSDQRFRGIDKDRARAYYGAQSGLEKLTSDMGDLYLVDVAMPAADVTALSNNPPSIPGVTFVAPPGVNAYGVTPVAFSCNGVTTFTCSAQIQSGPYQGLMALKKTYNLDAVARTASGGEAHLMRKMETVAIPVFQFGTFSDVDLSVFAGGTFTFGGRIHTNGNFFLTAQDGGTTTILEKVTAFGDIIRRRMQNNLTLNVANFEGTVRMATAPATFRNLLANEGSLTDGLGSAPNTSPIWQTTSIGTYNGYIRNGGCPAEPCPLPPRGTGAKKLNLALISTLIGGQNTDLSRRPVPTENPNGLLFGERLFGQVSVRILLSDTPGDITGLPTVTATAPIPLGEVAGVAPDWTNPALRPAGIPVVGPTNPPIARSPAAIPLAPAVGAFVTTAATNAGDTTIPFNAATFPATLHRPPYDALQTMDITQGALINRVRCRVVTMTQFQTCTPTAAWVGMATGAAIEIYTINGITYRPTINGAIAAGGVATRTFNVNSDVVNPPGPYTGAGPWALNTFWVQDNNHPTFAGGNALFANYPTLVTCTGFDSNAAWTLTNFRGCTGVPRTTNGSSILNHALHAPNTGLIGGYIKIEIQRAGNPPIWQDVTAEVLTYGIAGPADSGGCANGNPNAIIQLQRVKNIAAGCLVTGSQDSYDYWPNVIFDSREGLLRDVNPNSPRLPLAGLMHYVAIDVGNLNRWLRGVAPYGAGNGVNALAVGGHSIYFSDRRNNRGDGQKISPVTGLPASALNGETGEYGFEDVVNPLTAAGTPDNALDGGEDINANGVVDTYGQFPSSVNAGDVALSNTLPIGGLASAGGAAGTAGYDLPANVRPYLTVNHAQGMVNRTYLFRRALKLVNGGLASFATPGVTGLTFVTENPVYVQGDYNWNGTAALTDPHAATSVIADSVTLLSSIWTDTRAFLNPYVAANRPRVQNWYRLAIIGGKGMAFPWPAAGNPDTTFGTDGGAHNFLRYLETGGGTTNYRGAIATFYYSRQAIGTYKFNVGGGSVYSAPTRAYAFDTDFLDPARLPPLTPVFRDINALGFSQEIRPGK